MRTAGVVLFPVEGKAAWHHSRIYKYQHVEGRNSRHSKLYNLIVVNVSSTIPLSFHDTVWCPGREELHH